MWPLGIARVRRSLRVSLERAGSRHYAPTMLDTHQLAADGFAWAPPLDLRDLPPGPLRPHPRRAPRRHMAPRSRHLARAHPTHRRILHVELAADPLPAPLRWAYGPTRNG